MNAMLEARIVAANMKDAARGVQGVSRGAQGRARGTSAVI
jgi:hypothetical protein